MKSLIVKAAAILLCVFTSAARAGEEGKTYRYTGQVTGVACAACSKKVKACLQKLPGLTGVKITADKQPGIAKIEITSESPELSKELAVKALGKEAEAYQIQSLDRVAPSPAK